MKKHGLLRDSNVLDIMKKEKKIDLVSYDAMVDKMLKEKADMRTAKDINQFFNYTLKHNISPTK